MESHDETGCQAPECPMPCVNNCGFFGRAATMNMCSKCYKDTLLNQEQANLAASSIGSIISGNSSGNGKDPILTDSIDISAGHVEVNKISAEPSTGLFSDKKTSEAEGKVKDGPSRCNTCRRRVGLTGFHCKCGNLFCSAHRYSDKHDCPFDYRTTAQDAIAKANPVVKADKLDKI